MSAGRGLVEWREGVASRLYLMIGAGLGRSPTWIGCPTNIEITTRMATSTIRYLTTMRIFAGIVVSRSTMYHRMIVAIAISAAEAMSRIKFMVFLHLKVESRPSLNFMPRILEGLNPRRGLVEPRKGIGWRRQRKPKIKGDPDRSQGPPR